MSTVKLWTIVIFVILMGFLIVKKLYMKQMREGRLSSKGGAGLGFIDIRRKTGELLEYHFLPLTDKVSFFLLTAEIPRTI